MFSSIGSDLREFVSSLKEETSAAAKLVKEDTISVFDNLDISDEKAAGENLTEAEEEAAFRMTLTEVYTTPLNVVPVNKDTSEFADDDDDADFEEMKEQKVEDFEEIELQAFLQSFCVTEKTDEITGLLAKHDTTLRLRFEELVPVHVTYVDFWQRHFYRCDPARIQRAWDAEDAKAKAARSEAVQSVRHAILSSRPVHALMVGSSRLPLRSAILRSMSGSMLETKTSNDAELEQTKLALIRTREELEDMQHAVAASNNRIASLRTKLDETKERLEQAERRAAELKGDLDQTKAALMAKESFATTATQLQEQAAAEKHYVPATVEIKHENFAPNEQVPASSSEIEEGEPGNIKEASVDEESVAEDADDEESVVGAEESVANEIAASATSQMKMDEQPEGSGNSTQSVETTDHAEDEEEAPFYQTPTKQPYQKERPSPTSVMGRVSMFKLSGLWSGCDAEADEGSVSDGWGSDSEEVEHED